MLKRSICILLATIMAGCASGGGETSPSAGTSAGNPAGPVQQQRMAAGTPSNTGAATPAPTNASPAIAAAAPLPTIPAGARYSIFCESYSGSDHVTFSTNLKNLLSRNSQLKDWYVIHQSGQSSLYHGYYAEFDPQAAGSDKAMKREAERAQRDHKLVESIPNPQATDRKLFPRALFVPLDSPDPDAPPAWNLTNAPGFWTVQVAAFTGADRKRQTVEAVRQARADNIPAFYYHGPAVSSVCVGSWDRSAMKEQSASVAGSIDNDPGASKDGDFVLNMTGQALSKSDRSQLGPDGKPMRMLQVKTEILDPTLAETLKRFPAQAVDGFEVPLVGTDAKGNKVMRTRPSMIVMIPRATKDVAAVGSQTDEPDPTLIRPGSGSSSLGARLRGIGQ
jgi:hypothetical protein